jgi:hypothetical protein
MIESAAIWALVPGMSALPDAAARRRLLVALEAYIDDSGTGNPPVYLLGGFIARAESWAVFKEEWRDALNRPTLQPDGRLLRLDYFKMKEAHHLHEQFSGWDGAVANEKVVELVGIVKRHAFSGIFTGVMHDDYNEVVSANSDWPFKGPYFFTYNCLMTATLKFLNREGIDEPVDFIFDEQHWQSKLVQRAYDTFIETASPELKKRLGNRPIHRNDIDFVPLQAADLLAWNVRRWFFEKARGQKFASPVMEALGTIHQEEDCWTRARLEDYMRGYSSSFIRGRAPVSSQDEEEDAQPS